MFSPLFLDFLDQKESLKQFYSLYPSKDNFKKQLEVKDESFSSKSREVLVSSLLKQYDGLEVSEITKKNIEKLNDGNTFTITTGHQLNIFTGPLYFIYKIVTVVNACKELQDTYPDYNFIPVYWMASEDHDFEEISYINLGGKKYSWETDQTGAVGRFDPSSLKKVLDEMPGSNDIFKEAYLEQATLASAVRYYVNKIFGEDGLIVIDGDDHDLKSLFSHIIEKELVNQVSFNKVKKDTEKLEGLGYKAQIVPREINLFYLDKDLRERLVEENDTYKVLNSDLSFSEPEILDLVKAEPEKFSPNVILRPIYQEVVLPNIAYTGGPAEVIYWLQLKGIFDEFKIPFPILLPRNFVLYIDHVVGRKIGKTGIQIKEIFEPLNQQVDRYLREFSDNDLELSDERKSIDEIYNGIFSKASKVDETLESLIKAETQKIFNSLQKIEKKMLKAEKRHHDDHIRQIESINKSLFPGGGPQERSLNFLNFYLEDAEFISNIKASLSPFDIKYHIILDGSK